MTKRAVLYARVSGDDRRNATSSVEAQLDACRKYAGERGYQIVDELYEEPNKQTSGADWLPELDRALSWARHGRYDVLVAWKMDRVARNRFKQLSIENDLQARGIALEYAGERYDDTAEGRLLKGLMGEFAEFEREKIKQRTVRGIIRSVEKGNVTAGSCPSYGYDLGVKNGRRCLVINEYEAAIIRLIYDLYGNQGYSIHGVITYLAERGVPKPAKGPAHIAKSAMAKRTRWSEGTLSNILQNEAYLGRWYYRKTKSVKNPETGRQKSIPRPRSEWLMIEVPAIVDQALFDLVQKRRKQNRITMGKHAKNFYLLSGLLLCGECGKSIAGATNKTKSGKQSFYVCIAHHAPQRHGYYCDTQRVKVEVIDTAVWGWIKPILLSPEKLAESLAIYQGKQKDEHQPLLSMIEANEAKLEALHVEKDRLIKAYSQGILSLDEIATQKTALDKEIADLTRALADCRAELDPKLLGADDIATIQEWANEVRGGAAVIAESNPAGLRELFRLLQVKVTLFFEDTGGKHRALKRAKVECVLGVESLANDLHYDRL
jgi:site-specific DNA recombinase